MIFPELYLIDGHSLTFRAYYAIKNLRNPKGEPIGAVYGFLRMFLRFLSDTQPKHLAIIFDTGKPSFRKALYEPYKATRTAPPPDFSVQMGWIFELLKAMGIAVFSEEGYEADDLLGTMASKIKALGGKSWILSADKDLFQLVDSQTTVLRPGADNQLKVCGEGEVEATFGIRPDQMIDWLTLVGDSSDNIPGIPGVGEKTAEKLLREYGSIKAIFEQVDSIGNTRLKQSIKDNMTSAWLSYELATIRCDVPFEWSLQGCLCPTKDQIWNENFIALLHEHGFDSILKENGIVSSPALLPKSTSEGQGDLFEGEALTGSAHESVIHGKYDVLWDAEAIGRWVRSAMNAPWLAIDTETTSVNAMTCQLVGISLSYCEGEAVYIPVGHRPGLCDRPQPSIEVVKQGLDPLFSGLGPKLAGHHSKFDWKVLRRAGFDPVPPMFDTMVASYLLDPDKGTGHGLKALGYELCGIRMTPITELLGSGRNAITMLDVAVVEAAQYAACDADVTRRLVDRLGGQLKEIPTLLYLFETLEMPLIMTLLAMEMGGFNVNVGHLRELGHEASLEMAALTKKIWESVGRSFNINSTKQLAQVLFEELKLPPGRSGKTGYSTDEAELERLCKYHDAPRLILEYRGLEKLKSTYIEALPLLVNPSTGRIHTSFNQTIATTGRLTSTDPNLQNIPIRTPLGRSVRRAFIADTPQFFILKADYSQIELRLLAHITADPALRRAYHSNADIHRQTAAEIFDVAPEAVTGEMRAQAKVVNFGVIYGMGSHGLAQQLGISRSQAAQFIQRYFSTYAGVKIWMDQLLEEARKTGFVETLMGRRRLVSNLNAQNHLLRSNAERIAINAPIQGTCADMIKLAMNRIQSGIGDIAQGARMVCQVHDELVFSSPPDYLEALKEFVRYEMVHATPHGLVFEVPIEVDLLCGMNWADCE